jgi:ribonuclease HI
MEKVSIHVTGICYGNPGGRGGFGAVIKTDDERWEIADVVRSTTSNRIVLSGIIAALDELSAPCHVMVYTDSQYVVNGIRRARRWRDHDNITAKNGDLWKELLVMMKPHNVKFKGIRGKNWYYKSRCIRLARGAVEDGIF